MATSSKRKWASPLRVVVNADDFGITDSASTSIVECHRAGSVTSTTLMSNMPGAAFAAGLALDAPELGVGLHFNLTSGTPLSSAASVPSLLDENGQFLPRARLLRRFARRAVCAEHVSTEFSAQLRRMISLGLVPTHFDSHEHVHAVPLVFSILAREAQRSGAAIRLPHRWPGRVTGKSLGRRGSEIALAALVWACRRRLPAAVLTNDGFCSLFDLGIHPSDFSRAHYAKLLSQYEGGVVELMVHPATVDAELMRATKISEVSGVEAELLRSDFLKELVSARGGRLTNYRDAFF